MSRAGQVDIDVVAGDDLVRRLLFSNPDGSPIDASGWTFLGEVRADVTDAEPLASFEFDLAAATDGQVDAKLSAVDTALLAGRRFVNYFIRFTTDLDPVETHTAPFGRLNVTQVAPAPEP